MFEIIATVRRDKHGLDNNNHFPNLIKHLFSKGINRFRINLAKFDEDYANVIISDIENARKAVDGSINFILDFPYPGKKSRIKIMDKNGIALEENEKIIVYSKGFCQFREPNEIEISSNEVGKKLKENDIIYYGDGTISFKVDSVCNDNKVIISAMGSGIIENAKALNFSGSLECDENIYEFMLNIIEKVKCEYIALSFVESSKQVMNVKKDVEKFGTKIIAKIESEKGIENISEIAKAADEIMLGRGDLGLYSDINKFALSQEKVIAKTREKNKKIWVATDFMNSMLKSNIPSRAEIIDVYNTKKSGADGIILTYALVRSNRVNAAIDIINNQMITEG